MRSSRWPLLLLMAACGSTGGEGGSSPAPTDLGGGGLSEPGAGGDAPAPEEPWQPWGHCEMEWGDPCPCPDGHEGVYVCMDTGYCDCPAGVCGTDFEGFGDEEDACLEEHCCDGVVACMGPEADLHGCWDCLLGEGDARCAALVACNAEHDCSFAVGGGLCGTGMTYDHGGATDTCIDDDCCAEFVECAGSDVASQQACKSCLDAGEGAACASLLACMETRCGGGNGGGGDGGGGSGGAGGGSGGLGGTGGRDAGSGGA